VRGLQAATGQLEAEVARLQRQLELSEEKNQEVFQDNREMVMQLKALEQRKNDLHEKVRELQERDQVKNDSSTVARKEFDRLLAENAQLKADLARKDQSLRLIDGERDQLQAELDQETEERDRLERELAAVRE
jgi:chromosome segregation ATPase